jgi:phosphatidate phosphatase APP1
MKSSERSPPVAIDIATAARGKPRFGAVLQQFRRARSEGGPDALVLYFAYGANGRAVLEGRLIDHQIHQPFSERDSSLINLHRTLRLVFNAERPHRTVRVELGERTWDADTDAEGYFLIEMSSLDEFPPGWHTVQVSAGPARAAISLLLAPAQNRHGVISDVDDTIMITEVTRFSSMLQNTFLKNPLQRLIVPGMPALFRALAARNPESATAPLFYLSASPRQLHMPLQAVLDHHGFPPGVLITKRVTNDATREPLLDQMKYKLKRLEEILMRVPHATFTLLGDDGEHDPEIFDAISARYPERIDGIWIRNVRIGSHGRLQGQRELQELLQQHVR